MNQTQENGKKPNFGSNFDPFLPNLRPKFFFIDFTSTRCLTLSQAIIVCNFKENIWSKFKQMAKTSFWAWFRPIEPNFGLPNFFFQKNLRHFIFCFLYPRGWNWFTLNNIIKLNNEVLFFLCLKNIFGKINGKDLPGFSI